MMNLREYLMATHQGAELVAQADRNTLEWAAVDQDTETKASEAGEPLPPLSIPSRPSRPSRPRKPEWVARDRQRMKLVRSRAKLLHISEWKCAHFCRKVNEAWAALPPDTREAYEATFAAGGAR